MARARDGCAVSTVALAAVVSEWVDRYERSRAFVRDSGEVVGALHERTLGIGVPVPRKTIRNVLNARSAPAQRRARTTELWVADALVTAIDRPHVFHSGELPVLPNPSASRAARESCCGGSLNGSGQQLPGFG